MTTDEIRMGSELEILECKLRKQDKPLIFLRSLACVQNFYQNAKPVLLSYLSQHDNSTKVRFLVHTDSLNCL